jgi:DNA repair exonuclease SbcCD ATPase subunit
MAPEAAVPFKRMLFLQENADPPPGGSPPAPGAPPATPPSPPAESPKKDPLPPDVAAAELERARKEAAGYRERLRKLESDAEAAQKKALEEQGKFKELYEAEQKRAKELESKAHGYESAFKAQVDAEIAGVPEHLRKYAPADPAAALAWARDMKAAVTPGAPPPTPKPPATPPTAPAPATPGSPRTFTEEEIEGMSYDERKKLMPEIQAAMREGRIVSRKF